MRKVLTMGVQEEEHSIHLQKLKAVMLTLLIEHFTSGKSVCNAQPVTIQKTLNLMIMIK